MCLFSTLCMKQHVSHWRFFPLDTGEMRKLNLIGKAVSQSSTLGNKGDARNAIDGIFESNLNRGSCTQTSEKKHLWTDFKSKHTLVNNCVEIIVYHSGTLYVQNLNLTASFNSICMVQYMQSRELICIDGKVFLFCLK